MRKHTRHLHRTLSVATIDKKVEKGGDKNRQKWLDFLKKTEKWHCVRAQMLRNMFLNLFKNTKVHTFATS